MDMLGAGMQDAQRQGCARVTKPWKTIEQGADFPPLAHACLDPMRGTVQLEVQAEPWLGAFEPKIGYIEAGASRGLSTGPQAQFPPLPGHDPDGMSSPGKALTDEGEEDIRTLC